MPLWLLNFHTTASAQLTIEVAPAITPAAATPTIIQPATSDTSVVRESNQFNILGGQSSGGTAPNLIHQFQQFDLGSADAANFVVDPNVANVISLINALQPSSIDGLLKVTSNDLSQATSANLFLVNPAGIVFGENVSLSLPANLTATTASGLLFDETYLLSIDGSVSDLDSSAGGSVISINAIAPTLSTPTINNLTGNPIGYLMLSAPASSVALDPLSPELPTGSIENQGSLEVTPQATITFIGHYIQNDGKLVAPGGTINLVATAGDTLLRLNQPGSLLSFDVVPADTLAAIATTAVPDTLATTELAQLLTGGNEQSATEIVVNSDGSQTLTNSPPSLAPTPGTVLVRGVVDVSDDHLAAPNSSPGQVTMLGNQINLVGGDIFANGVSQAGTLSIGGMPVEDGFSAAYVLVDRNSTLQANSETSQGGSIDIWANHTVRFYGTATATGARPQLDGTVTIEAGKVLDIRPPAAR
ncbi:two-partner secretion domain-containing protein [Leptothoe sp. PORK10 BA2]|uniref:two-partner secretion domain-containing protein n=1 Tax=Leptothoe sp. PORK10 BA2 TaxID=3110254 RepID=UPI002B204D61|nr:filamentous hemagglutinin N-terminal domain-containing protein [Leptothoe sp. PORK10 BA2]MEA5463009.1 filamentous hemagglutinin N-terminal domain-containing protein [Leptothoe sp. PORK10 BA2]